MTRKGRGGTTGEKKMTLTRPFIHTIPVETHRHSWQMLSPQPQRAPPSPSANDEIGVYIMFSVFSLLIVTKKLIKPQAIDH